MTDIQSVTDDVPCGCGPTAEEARTLRGGITRRRALSAGAIGVFLAATGASLAPSAFAAEYPTWDDVEKARNNEAAKGAEVTRIQGLIRSLEQDVDTKQAEADRLGQEHVLALEAYEDAVARAESLQQQADAESARADAAAAKLGALAADQYRSGNTDPTLDLFFSGSAGSAEDLLSRLGTMDRLVDANREVYADAAGARDSARHLSDQAQVARDERNRREAEAEQKMQTAQAAAQAALAALASQNGYRDALDAQLAALQDTTSRTISQYRAGVEVRRREREARIRRAREAAAARAREEERRRREEERRRQAPNNVGTGGESSSSGGGGGKVQSSGWVRPAHGWISSWFGTRGSICRNGYCTRAGHRGIDFASSCGSPIYAAYPGTVIFAGYSGAWGNYIKIQHADGTVTGYAHIINGGYNVNYGQRVRAGQVIAYIGSTGASSGCHLHFEVYIGGVRVDPAPFLRARGVAV